MNYTKIILLLNKEPSFETIRQIEILLQEPPKNFLDSELILVARLRILQKLAILKQQIKSV